MARMSLSYEGNVAVLKFNHPEVMNAVGKVMLADLRTAVAEVRHSKARALLLTGEGRGFCAGANLQDDAPAEANSGAGSSLRMGYNPLLLAMRELPMPIVTSRPTSSMTNAPIGLLPANRAALEVTREST